MQSDGKFPLNYELTLAKNAKVLKDTPATGKSADAKFSIDGATKLHLNMKRKKDGTGRCNFYVFSIKEASVTVQPSGVHVVS